MVFVSLSSILISAYYSCFGYKFEGLFYYLDISMEVTFALDIGRNFILEYVDI